MEEEEEEEEGGGWPVSESKEGMREREELVAGGRSGGASEDISDAMAWATWTDLVTAVKERRREGGGEVHKES